MLRKFMFSLPRSVAIVLAWIVVLSVFWAPVVTYYFVEKWDTAHRNEIVFLATLLGMFAASKMLGALRPPRS